EKLRDPAEALRLTMWGTDKFPESGDWLTLLAFAQHRTGDSRGALVTLDRAKNASGEGEIDLCFLHAMVLHRLGEPDRARERCGAAIAAMDPAGNSVIAWDDAGGHDGDGRGIFAQRFNAAGVPQGGEFQVNSTTAGDQEDPSVAMTASGAFVVVWGPHGYGYPPGTFGPIHAQRYDASGVPQGSELTANTTIYGRFPRVAIDSVGNFVVTWERT